MAAKPIKINELREENRKLKKEKADLEESVDGLHTYVREQRERNDQLRDTVKNLSDAIGSLKLINQEPSSENINDIQSLKSHIDKIKEQNHRTHKKLRDMIQELGQGLYSEVAEDLRKTKRYTWDLKERVEKFEKRMKILEIEDLQKTKRYTWDVRERVEKLEKKIKKLRTCVKVLEQK